MDFSDSPEEARFRAEARAWLEKHVPSERELAGMDEVERCKYWQKRKYDAGWACIRWPKEYGGRDSSAMQQVIWNQEESRLSPPTGVLSIGQGMAAPTLMQWANEEVKRKHLPPLASGEHIWCQLFSEPASGSDLAALRMRAEREGDDWILNGQKIWTSGAHYSDYGIVVARSDPTVPKHQGLTYFFVDMKSAGIETRPIKQISGDSNFNEVYFNDVRVPDRQRLGAVGQGWQVSMTTLMHERLAIGGGGGLNTRHLFRLAEQTEIDGRPAIEDRAVRARLAHWYCREMGLKYTGYRAMTALSRGEIPGPENSISKLVGAVQSQDMASFAMDLLEFCGAVMQRDLAAGEGQLGYAFLGSPGIRIAGGSDEIMLNILAERVLGMPQDPRVDKGIPFHEIATGSKN